jgi:hypothetical protein
MSKVYDGGHEHTFCYVNHPKSNGPHEHWHYESWHSTFPIVLHTGVYVWISASYLQEGHSLVKRIGDGRSNGYDDHGICILSVPAEWCEYYTTAEATAIEESIAADDRLLRYAR